MALGHQGPQPRVLEERRIWREHKCRHHSTSGAPDRGNRLKLVIQSDGRGFHHGGVRINQVQSTAPATKVVTVVAPVHVASVECERLDDHPQCSHTTRTPFVRTALETRVTMGGRGPLGQNSGDARCCRPPRRISRDRGPSVHAVSARSGVTAAPHVETGARCPRSYLTAAVLDASSGARGRLSARRCREGLVDSLPLAPTF